MRKLLFSIICILSLSFLFSACGQTEVSDDDNFEETTISVDKNGRIRELIIEPFEKDYYDVDELKSELENAISDIKLSDSECEISLKDISVQNGNVYIKLDFANGKSYNALQNQEIFTGTVGDACAAGYSMDVTLKNVNSDEMIGKVEVMGMQDRHIIIMDEHVRLKCYRPVVYVSANVEVINENEIRVLSEASGLAYIILDK